MSRNDIHTAPNQKLESSISRTARLLCTFYSRVDPGDKDSASSAVSGRQVSKNDIIRHTKTYSK